MSTCPVVAAQNEIRGAGLDDETGLDDARLVTISGGSARIVDEIAFHMTTIKLDLARFLLTNPSQLAAARYAASRGWATETDTLAIYARMMEYTVSRSGLLDQLDAVDDMLARLDEVIIARVTQRAADGKTINISVPDRPKRTAESSLAMLYKPELLAVGVCALMSWVNQLSVTDLGAKPASPLGDGPAWTGSPPHAKKVAAANNLAGLQARLDAELEVCAHVRQVETFHIDVIAALGRVVDRVYELSQ